METKILQHILETKKGKEADSILRSCVHCGFCNATCPTYQIQNDELDGPRGRIYQIKLMLEGQEPSREVQKHLDRCLLCLNCTTTCPSGVKYNHLVEIGKEFIEEHMQRPLQERFIRWSLRKVLPFPNRFAPLMKAGQFFRPLLPSVLKDKIPLPVKAILTPSVIHARKIILPKGCVQPTLTPNTDAAAIRVFNQLHIEALVPESGGCCGAVSQHLSAPEEAKRFMKNNIDSWWPLIEEGAEAILITASGCGLMVKDYGHHLKDDPSYSRKAKKVSALCKDLCEILTVEDLLKLETNTPKKIAFHAPCTLQHGQKLLGKTEALLRGAGFELVPVKDAHSCCGSAGTYSVLQPKLAGQLRLNKLQALVENEPTLIATANIGCQTHLQSATDYSVIHWIELFDQEKIW